MVLPTNFFAFETISHMSITIFLLVTWIWKQTFPLPESWLSLGNACFLRSWWRESAECCPCVHEVGSRCRQWGAYSAARGRTTFFLENRWVNLVFISGQRSDPNVNLYWNAFLQTKALKHILRNCMLLWSYLMAYFWSSFDYTFSLATLVPTPSLLKVVKTFWKF